MKTRIIVSGLLTFFCAVTFAQSPFDALTESDLAEGEKLFRVHCARCHGIDGGGGEGSNLARSKLKYAPDDESLIRLLGEGIPGTGMPEIWTLDVHQAGSLRKKRCPATRSGARSYINHPVAAPPVTLCQDTDRALVPNLRTLEIVVELSI